MSSPSIPARFILCFFPTLVLDWVFVIPKDLAASLGPIQIHPKGRRFLAQIPSKTPKANSRKSSPQAFTICVLLYLNVLNFSEPESNLGSLQSADFQAFELTKMCQFNIGWRTRNCSASLAICCGGRWAHLEEHCSSI